MIATTVVLVSVFAPVAFLKDSIGRVFAELAVTIAAAVVFSAVLALSLSPMMCSKLLRSSTREESKLTHTLVRRSMAVETATSPAAADAARAVGYRWPPASVIGGSASVLVARTSRRSTRRRGSRPVQRSHPGARGHGFGR